MSYTGEQTEIVLPESCHGKSYEIYKYAFYYRYDLTSVVIGNSVESLGSYAFAYCTNLSELTIGNSVRDIGSSAFYGCHCLTSVYYVGSESEWSSISIGGYNFGLTSATRYYYSASEPTTEGNYWRYVNGVPTAW